MSFVYDSPLGAAVAYRLASGSNVEVDARNATTPISPEGLDISDSRTCLRLRSAGDIIIYFGDPADPGVNSVVHPAGDWFVLRYAGRVWVNGASEVHVIEAY